MLRIKIPSFARVSALILSLTLLPGPSWADAPVFAVFGKPPTEEGEKTIGDPLTCANAHSAIGQWNSGKPYSMQGSPVGAYAEWIGGKGLPEDNFPFQGDNAPEVPGTPDAPDFRRNPAWAGAPSGSAWVYSWYYTDPDTYPPPNVPNTMPRTPMDNAYVAAIWIPTAEDAARMRVTMTYRAQDQLIAVVRNELSNPNLLTNPITRDTSSQGTAPGTVQLNSGWRQGANYVTFFVHNEWDAKKEAQNYAGFAASFSANCEEPKVTAVPTLDAPTLFGMLLSVGALGAAYARRLRKPGVRAQRSRRG